MGSISGFMGQAVNFVKEHKTSDIVNAVQHMDWQLILHSPFFWLITIPCAALLILRRHYGTLLLGFTGVLFLVLVRYTAPLQEEGISIAQLVKFLGGCVVLLGINVYYFIIARD